MRLRKKRVEIEGFQMTAERMLAYMLEKKFDGWPSWAIKAANTPPEITGAIYRPDKTASVWFVNTLEGVMHVIVDDWILRGAWGELYPCKPGVLALTYDVLGPDEEGT